MQCLERRNRVLEWQDHATRKAHWFDEECKQAAEEVGRRRAQWLNGGGEAEEELMRAARREMNRLTRRKKRIAMECELEKIEQSKQAGRVRAHFQSIIKMSGKDTNCEQQWSRVIVAWC